MKRAMYGAAVNTTHDTQMFKILVQTALYGTYLLSNKNTLIIAKDL